MLIHYLKIFRKRLQIRFKKIIRLSDQNTPAATPVNPTPSLFLLPALKQNKTIKASYSNKSCERNANIINQYCKSMKVLNTKLVTKAEHYVSKEKLKSIELKSFVYISSISYTIIKLKKKDFMI